MILLNITTTDTLDKVIAVLIALFIMSVITEKITTLIRKYPRFFQIIAMCASAYLIIICVVSLFYSPRFEYAVVLLIAAIFCIFSTTSSFINTIHPALPAFLKSKNPTTPPILDKNAVAAMNPLKNVAHQVKDVPEDVKSDEVTLLSFIVGLIVAFAFKADMMAMFQDQPMDYGVWSESLLHSSYLRFNPELVFSYSVFFGILTSGFFLSFGSKFFHDLIDTLLQTKDLKRKLNNPETYEVNKIDELEEFVSINDIDLARNAIDENEETLKKKFPNIMYISDTMANVNGKRVAVAAIYLSDNNKEGLPLVLPGRLKSGKTYSIPTEIITDVGKAKPHSGMTKPIAGRASPGFTGSGCCIITRDDETFLVTCCHVFSENDVIEPIDEPTGKRVLCANKNIGEWVFGRIDSTGDFALAHLEEPSKFIRDNNAFTFSGIHDVTTSDYSTLKVTIEGNASGVNTEAWVLDSVKDKVFVEYNNGREITFEEVIMLGSTRDKDSSAPVTQTHDSGGSVYNSSNELIGIIVGANNKFTIVLPVRRFFRNNNLTLI